MQKLYLFVLKLVAAAQARAYLFILPCLFPQKKAKLESLLEVSFGIQSCWLELPPMSNQNDNVLLKNYSICDELGVFVRVTSMLSSKQNVALA